MLDSIDGFHGYGDELDADDYFKGGADNIASLAGGSGNTIESYDLKEEPVADPKRFDITPK